MKLKKNLAALLTAAMLTSTVCGIAESATAPQATGEPAAQTTSAPGNALDAFNALTGQTLTLDPNAAVVDTAQILAGVMQGVYAARPTDASAAALATALPELTAVSSKDIAAYAAKNRLPVLQVRNAYYKALANTLSAEIMVNPASEERYRNVQTILQLFLTDDSAAESVSMRAQIRQNMDSTSAKSIATDYGLPAGFIEFIVMDEQWNDDRWDNDEDWRTATTQSAAAAPILKRGDRDNAGSTAVTELQQALIALGYLGGMADGVFGERTEDALIEYQLANGRKATGRLYQDDLTALRSGESVARWDYTTGFDGWMDEDDRYDHLYDDDWDDRYDDWDDRYDDWDDRYDDWDDRYDDWDDRHDDWDDRHDDWDDHHDDDWDDDDWDDDDDD